MIIMKDRKPVNTVYYISGCILKEILNKEEKMEILFQKLKKRNNKLEYKDFILSLDFLYLIDKIKFQEGSIKHATN